MPNISILNLPHTSATLHQMDAMAGLIGYTNFKFSGNLERNELEQHIDEHIIDLLVDLQHFCRTRSNLNFDSLLKAACEVYNEETA